MMNSIILLVLFQISYVFNTEVSKARFSNEIINPVDSIAASKSKQTHNRVGVPQSLTLLMNFKNDGTTSLQIMQGSQIVYLDSGLCKYGQLFDPATGRCRDIYCQEINYTFNGTTCIPDDSKAATAPYKKMSDIDLLLTLVISNYRNESERVPFSKRLHSQMNETCTNDWATMFHNTLHNYLDIDYERIINIRYELKENKNDDDEISQPSSTVTSNPMSRMSKINDNNMFTIPSNIPTYDIINERIDNNESVTVNFHFSIADRNETSSDTLTGLHVVTLLLLASEFHVVLDFCQNYSVKVETISIISDTNKTQTEFCDDPDVMLTTKNGLIRRRIKSDGDIDYVVDVPELETTYESGDYTYLFIVSTLSQQQTSNETSTSSSAMKLVSVCNRQPRIVGRCPDSVVMRIALCEVTQYTNLSIRIKRTGRLYTNREYRYDHFRADLYVVVCKHDTYNGTHSNHTASFFEKAPGFLSTIAMFLSICALTITLITFILFSSLRNLPGCNVINLIIALIIAESLFLSQSLMLMTRSSVCLLFALGIHFFYLASFFWMNVMAFDLWKTFHKGFSLYVYDIRERLPYYAIYAWGMPVIIVLIGIILDVRNAPLKPCYGRYFRGCYDICFHTKHDEPLQGCWIESAWMRFVLFGVPVAIILIVNFIFYALTVRSIRRGLKSVRIHVERKFQQKKQIVPGEHDVKIYMRMAVLAGFGWTIGFILFVLPDRQQGFVHYLAIILKYLFILLNATPGLFIFVVYVCNRRVYLLYHNLYTKLIQSKYQRIKEYIQNKIQICFYHLKKKFSKKTISITSQPIQISNLRRSLSEPLPKKQPIKAIWSIS